jgi:branched-chain amino acid transport system substrate-binding protein
VAKELTLPFPNVEFQALLTEIAAAKPDAVYTFFAGGGAVKFVKDYAAAGLKGKIPLYGPGFLTDGTLDAHGGDAAGLFTTLHYADSEHATRQRFPACLRHGLQAAAGRLRGPRVRRGANAGRGSDLDQG